MENIDNIFGFSIAPASSADIIPIVKYNAVAGRVFRVDRVVAAAGTESRETDITVNFKAQFDFEHLEVGWMLLIAGTPPNFQLVPWGSKLPPQPTPQHKNGSRVMVKLSAECADGTPRVREIASATKAMLNGLGAVYAEYLKEKDAHTGLLPIIVLEKTTPVKTGTGATVSTNYHPVFRIVDWKPRGDLVFVGKAGAVPSPASTAAPATANTPPSTGSTRASAPMPAAPVAQAPKQTADADDFG